MIALERASDDMLEIVHCEIPLHTFPSLHCSGSWECSRRLNHSEVEYMFPTHLIPLVHNMFLKKSAPLGIRLSDAPGVSPSAELCVVS